MTEEQLEEAAEKAARLGRLQDAAIAAFVLAKCAKNRGDEKRFNEKRTQCMAHLNGYNTDTLEGCAHTYTKIAGVYIPELFHTETVLAALAA